MSVDNRQMLPIGTMLHTGTYRVDEYLSSGGFGNTYIVTNVQFDERRAMKEFFIKGVSEREGQTTVSVSNEENMEQFAQQRDKFKKEARRLRQMNNANIVRVHDLFEENGTAYYVMDLVDGESLSARLKRTGKPLTEKEATDVLHQVLNALEEVHGQHIWHLDLKPGNIMTDRKGCVKLIDFGASKQMERGKSYTSTSSALCYTPGYAPSEQLDGDFSRIGAWTDLYALGATIYNLLTSELPPSPTDIMNDGEQVFRFPSGVSQRMRQLIIWMMQPSYKRRAQSVAEVRKRLDAVEDETKPQDKAKEETPSDGEATRVASSKKKKPSPSTHHPIPEQSSPARTCSLARARTRGLSRRWLWPALIGAVVVIGGLLALLLGGGGGSEKNSVPEADNVIEKTDGTINVENFYFRSGLGACSYTGTLDEDSLPHGDGTARFDRGDYYDGTFEHGKMQGDSCYYRFDNGDEYRGSFEDDHFTQGRIELKSTGYTFEGTFTKQNQPDKGQWYDKDGKAL